MACALVLGATGHIGAHIVRALLANGHQVRAAYRRDRFLGVLEQLPVVRVRVDLDTGLGLREALAGCEWIFHAAGYYPGLRAQREQAIAHAVESTRRIVDEFRKAKPQRIVFTSSAATIRYTPERPATEADPEPWPLSEWRTLYATVKIAMEHEMLQAHQAGLPIVVVNPTLCLGEYDARSLSGLAILAFAKHRLPCYLGHDLNAVYTGDVGIGHVRAAERGRLGERYLLTQHDVTIKEFAERVCTLAGVPPPRWRLPDRLAYAMACGAEALAWVMRTEPVISRQVVVATRTGGKRLDGSKAVRELGFPHTSLEEAIRRALDWFKQHGYV